MSYAIVAAVAVVVYIYRAEIWAWVSGVAVDVTKDDQE